jgi:hypothetical protein
MFAIFRYKLIAMSDYQKLQSLSAKFSMLADRCAYILWQYGSLYDCPVEKRIEFVRYGREQEFVQQQINELFAINDGRISA